MIEISKVFFGRPYSDKFETRNRVEFGVDRLCSCLRPLSLECATPNSQVGLALSLSSHSHPFPFPLYTVISSWLRRVSICSGGCDDQASSSVLCSSCSEFKCRFSGSRRVKKCRSDESFQMDSTGMWKIFCEMGLFLV